MFVDVCEQEYVFGCLLGEEEEQRVTRGLRSSHGRFTDF